MTSILRPLLEEKENKIKEQLIEEKRESREELSLQRLRIEEKIRKFDRKQIDNKIKDALIKLEEITDSVSDIQNSLNIVWKRTKQVEEELKEALGL